MIRFRTAAELKQASDILRAEYPKPMISHTVDVHSDLSPLDRQILSYSERMKTKLLPAPKTI